MPYFDTVEAELYRTKILARWEGEGGALCGMDGLARSVLEQHSGREATACKALLPGARARKSSSEPVHMALDLHQN